MDLNISQLVVWLVVGALAGTLTSMLFYRTRTPITDAGSIVLGLLGLLVGSMLFNFFNIRLGLPVLAVSGDGFVAAILGSFLLLLLARFLRR